MTTKTTLTLIGLTIVITSVAQSKLDSLINLRKTDALGGKLPTYYTPGHKDIALQFQDIITEAIDYYEARYSKKFEVKLIVLDSSQWLTEILTYGFVFYDGDWIVMAAEMNYESFKEIYGLQSYFQELDKELKRQGISEQEIIKSFFEFYSIHELGHYFIHRLSNAISPNPWMDEFIASYLSYNFFKSRKSNDLKTFELFCRIDRDYYSPKYSTIKDFNEKYAGTGLPNYRWYHSNFFFLLKSLFECKGEDFIAEYEAAFPKKAVNERTTEDIINILDKDCKGVVKQWVIEIESKTMK